MRLVGCSKTRSLLCLLSVLENEHNSTIIFCPGYPSIVPAASVRNKSSQDGYLSVLRVCFWFVDVAFSVVPNPKPPVLSFCFSPRRNIFFTAAWLCLIARRQYACSSQPSNPATTHQRPCALPPPSNTIQASIPTEENEAAVERAHAAASPHNSDGTGAAIVLLLACYQNLMGVLHTGLEASRWRPRPR